MEFPRFVFTAPGPVQCQGGTYGQELVGDEAEHGAALLAGFKDSVPEALAARSREQEVKPAAPAAAPAPDVPAEPAAEATAEDGAPPKVEAAPPAEEKPAKAASSKPATPGRRRH